MGQLAYSESPLGFAWLCQGGSTLPGARGEGEPVCIGRQRLGSGSLTLSADEFAITL